MEDARCAIEAAGCEMLSKDEHQDFAAAAEPILRRGARGEYGNVPLTLAEAS
jgi:hypothetical protein